MNEGRVLSAEEKQALIGGSPLEEKTDDNKEKVEQKVEDKTDVKTDESEKETEKEVGSDFSLDAFNKKFGKEIENEDYFESLFEKAEKYDETKSSYDETVQKLSEYQTLSEKLDPMSNFKSEDEYKRQQLLIKKGDELSEDAIKALSVLNPSKVKEMSDVDALKTQLMIEKGVTSKEAEAVLLHKYGLDELNMEDADSGLQAVMKVDAIDARNSVSDLYTGIEIPTKVDYEASRVELKQSWENPVSEIVKSIDKIQLAEGIDFVVTDEMKQGLEESTLAWVMSKQIKPSDDSGAAIIGQLKDQIILNNLDNVVKSISTDLTEKIKAETRSTIHNDKPLDESTRTTDSTDDNDSKMSKLLG